jgi:hypothetical protein
VTARGNGGRIVGVFDASTLHQGVASAAVPCAGGSGTTSISPWELTPNLAAIGSCSGMDSIDGGSDQPFGGCLPLMSESDSKPPRAEALCPLAGESLALPKSVESGNLSFSNRPPEDVG